MRTILAALQVLCPIAASAADLPLRFGVVTVDGPLVCLQAPAPPQGSDILLVDPDLPQTTRRATVAASSHCPAPVGQGGQAAPGVELVAPGARQPGVLIAVIGPTARVTTRAGHVEVREQGSPSALRFRSCASSDGLHLTVWRGVPLRSARTWHGYAYLNQDLDPDCTATDTR